MMTQVILQYFLYQTLLPIFYSKIQFFNNILSSIFSYLCFSHHLQYNYTSIMLLKWLVSILICLFLLHISVSKSIESYTLKEFKHQFKKTYSPKEQAMRMINFNKHKKFILEQQKKGLQIPPNDLMDRTDQELSQLTGLPQEEEIIQTQNGNRKPQFRASAGFAVPPKAYDYRDYGKVTSAKRQKACGSCWAFAAAAHYQSLLLVASSQEYDLAEQFLLQCTEKSSCRGGWPHKAIDLIKQIGLPTEDYYPYQANDTYYIGICEANTTDFIKLAGNITANRYDKFVYTEVSQLKQLLLQNGPMTVGVKAGHSFFYNPLANGSIQECPTNQTSIDHTVLLVGYTQSHWIIKNSWSPNWGDEGFAYIPFSNDCGILTHVWVVETDAIWETPTFDDHLLVEMVDTAGNGWNGNVFGIKQNNEIVATFGQQFISGQSASKSVVIPGNIPFTVVLTSLGTLPKQIGFTLKREETGEVLANFEPGSSNFTSQTVFAYVCQNCENIWKKYYIKLTDLKNDGWNGNTLIISQGDKSYEIGANFITGAEFGPIELEFLESSVIIITAGILQAGRKQIGYIVTDSYGGVLARRDPGSSYTATHILSSFVPALINTFPVSLSLQAIAAQNQNSESQISQQGASTPKTVVQNTEDDSLNSQQKALVVAVVCQSVVILVLMISFIFIVKKMTQGQRMKGKGDESVGTATSLKIPSDQTHQHSGIIGP